MHLSSLHFHILFRLFTANKSLWVNQAQGRVGAHREQEKTIKEKGKKGIC